MRNVYLNNRISNVSFGLLDIVVVRFSYECQKIRTHFMKCIGLTARYIL